MRSHAISTLIFFLVTTFAYSQQRSIVRFGSDVVVERDEQVRDAVSIGGDVRVAGQVTNDAVAVGGSVYLLEGAVVEGSAVSIGGIIDQAPRTSIGGDIVEIGAPWRAMPREAWARVFIGFQIFTFLGTLALALLIVALLPQQMESVSNVVRSDPAKSALWGIITAVAFMPLIFILVVSIIGIVLIPVFIILFILALFIGYIAAAIFVGEVLFKAAHRPQALLIWRALVGFVILSIIGWIPVLGWLITTVATLLGTGALILTVTRARGGKKRVSGDTEKTA